MASNTQFTVARGETWKLPVTLSDSSSNPKDITNYSFTGSLKLTYSDDEEYDFTITKVLPYESGSIEIFLDTINMTAGEYVYSVFAEEGSERRSILEGNFIIRDSTL